MIDDLAIATIGLRKLDTGTSPQILAGVNMEQSDGMSSLPQPAVTRLDTLNDPIISAITDPIVSKSRHFLLLGQGRGDAVRVEIPLGGHVRQANLVATANGRPWIALFGRVVGHAQPPQCRCFGLVGDPRDNLLARPRNPIPAFAAEPEELFGFNVTKLDGRAACDGV